MSLQKQHWIHLGVLALAGLAWMTWSEPFTSSEEVEASGAGRGGASETFSRRHTESGIVQFTNRSGARSSASAGGRSALPDRALERILASEKPESEEDLADVMRQWVESEALVTAEFARDIERPELREAMMRVVMQAWARKDPEAAMAWATGLADPQAAESAAMHVCIEISEADPEFALELAGEHGLDRTTEGLAGNIVARWAGLDFSAACAWARRQPAGGARDELLSRIAFAHSRDDPAAAAQMVADEVSPGSRQIEAAISVVHQWGRQDPGAATDWVHHFGDGPLRERALMELEGIQRYRLREMED